jgi:hypothetical protein
MIFSQKPASTFPDHAFLVEHDLFGKPASTFPDHAFLVEHDLFGKPASTFPDHALAAAQRRAAASLKSSIKPEAGAWMSF